MEKFLKEAAESGERCVLVVDSAAIRRNAGYLIKKTGKKLIAVVKANAYGAGLKETVKALEKTARMFAVATTEEALVVSSLGAKALVLSPVSERELKEGEGRNIAVCISDKEGARAAANYRVPVHIAVNTGMNRYGADCRDIGNLLEICDVDGLDTEGIYTHFACADKDGMSEAEEAAGRFSAVVKVLGAGRFRYVHSANSAASLRTQTVGNCVRAGLALYGVNPQGCHASLAETVRFYARVLFVRTLRQGEALGYGGAYVSDGVKRIAVIGAGYADGLPYGLKNHGSVLINGKVCGIVGNVCMDCAFVDVTSVQVREGDYALIFGGEGDASFCVQAQRCGTIPYELLTGISDRVKREYVRQEPLF